MFAGHTIGRLQKADLKIEEGSKFIWSPNFGRSKVRRSFSLKRTVVLGIYRLRFRCDSQLAIQLKWLTRLQSELQLVQLELKNSELLDFGHLRFSSGREQSNGSNDSWLRTRHFNKLFRIHSRVVHGFEKHKFELQVKTRIILVELYSFD